MDLITEFLAAIPLPALMVDQSERVIGANSEACALLGQSLTDRHFSIVLRQPAVIDAIESALQDRKSRTTRYLGNDGAQDTTFEVSLRYVNGVGAVSGGAVLLSFFDVSEREQAGQMRRDFVANVSHELRTPLTAMLGFIETLRGAAKDDPAARDRFLQIMEGEGSRMNRLVDDLLSLNRVESEERVRPRESVDLSAHLNSVIRSLSPLAKEAGATLTLDAPEQPVIVPADADQLQQVFANLIENAIKYGGDEIRIVLTEDPRDRSLRAAAARVDVSDNGPGIDAIHLPRLTERFYRADSHRSREMGGTGLGLAIVKHIINRHRGRLKVDSTLGQGSVFSVILPR
jgi:two-component system phosphate regulon sensor histidine kinase PhoR